MATSEMIDRACKSDEELYKPGMSPSPLNSSHAMSEVEEEVDPTFHGLAGRWLRRERPAGWETILDVLDLLPGGPLTPWPKDLARARVCLGEAKADQEAVEVFLAARLVDYEDEPARASLPAPRPRRRPEMAWSDRAACRGADGWLFFGPDGEQKPQREARERKAKPVCRLCPARSDCLDHALTYPEKAGVWGGMGEDQRASERRRRMRRGELPPAPIQAVRPKFVVAEKLCRTCHLFLPAAEFYTDNRTGDGLAATCRDCSPAAGQERRRDAAEAKAS